MVLKNEQTLTCHSFSPWELSELAFLTATAIPTPTLDGAYVFSSIHPLKTLPKPPSPKTVSGLKFLVALFSSANVNIFKFGIVILSVETGSLPLFLGLVLSFVFLDPSWFFLLPFLDATAHYNKLINKQLMNNYIN